MDTSDTTALAGFAAARPRFYLLGAFAATLEGQPVALPPRRVQSLLAALLLDPGPWRRVQLAGRLFPEASERRARQRVSHTLWQTRQWLPTLPLETTPETVYLPPESVWLDARVFREATTAEDLGAWVSALALYRGDLLTGIYDDWLLEEREATYLRYVHLSHRTCAALWQRGDIEILLPVAERLVQSEPLDERALRMLMRAYQALGRRGAALATYDRCTSHLLDQLGIGPEPATRALAEVIQRTPSVVRIGQRPDVACWPDEEPGSVREMSFEALVTEVRAALRRGTRGRVDACLEVLRTHRQRDADALRLLEADVALSFEEFPHAAALLGDIDHPGASAAERLRGAHLALGTHDSLTAQRRAAEVLVALREADGHDPVAAELEIEALLILARAQQRLGERGHATLSSEKALGLARKIGYHRGMVQALLIDGQGRIDQGRHNGAGSCFREARAIALEHGLSYDLALALRGLRTVLSHTSVLSGALEIAQEELSLWRDLGIEQREAAALEGIATIQNHLGRSSESLRTMAQAQELSDRHGDPLRIATNRYHLACAMVYHDDALAPEAAKVARNALDTCRAHGQLGWEARLLEIIGYALWVDGQHEAALDVLMEAEAVTRRMGELAYLPELLAYQGLAHIGLCQPDEALARTHQAVTLLAQGGVSDEVVPEILYAHAAALMARDREPDADRYLRQAYTQLLDGAAAFEEAPARQAFFHRNPTMRRLMRELQTRGIAPPPGAVVQAVQLQAALGDGMRSITWTVDGGPADAALERAEGPIALRRARLARLLNEAREQGGVPTVADLARTLNVSKRTTQRDLGALRD